MRNAAFLTVLAVALALAACDAHGGRGTCKEDPIPTIEFVVGPTKVEYATKDTDPVPGFQRSCPFEVKVTWTPETSDEVLTLGDFVAVDFQEHPEKWQDREPRVLHENGSPVDGNVAVFTKRGPENRIFTLPSEARVQRPRLILYSLKLRTASGVEVSFDPPWSEKKR